MYISFTEFLHSYSLGQPDTTLGVTINRNREPFKLTFLFRLHNIILSVGSLVLLLLMLEEM
jgi:hypothetical protein